MAVAARRDTRMTVSEFRPWAEPRPDEERWELIDGIPLLMSPPSARHQRIVSNLIRRLDEFAEGWGCNALPGLGVLSAAVDDFAPIPDIVVTCGPLGPDGYASDTLLVAEVLSPSTMSLDRGRKTDFYRSVPSLRTFLIVSQDEVRVEAWRRTEAGSWTVEALYRDDSLVLPELGGAVPVGALYTGLPL
ncbi:Uma2 family endonuclease [Methylobacterium sp. W2]|uniref:Uma2 family endonuclease n=1 Tax=Methylobacterium sp. W2 TaxID=2598107 RepID=UPI001D0CB3F3|nr:Uma2 family endonuclease [Methylobacterium sp. W2]MCC0805275.1 Uma2 family endonuclease [Methylobacterium sp. W2]